MNHHYLKVIGCFLFSFSGYTISIAQSTGPEFLMCTDTVLRLCVQDDGVRLPDNNQVYLGEGDPDATSCSVHVTQKKRVQATCGNTLQYEVLLFLNDTSPAITLTPLTSIVVDSSGEAELIFDTALSPDSAIQHAGIPYNLDCNDKYRIVWTAVDSCGQDTSCISYLHLFDCGKPTVSTYTTPIVAILPSGCQLTMYAKDFYIGGLDDCSLSDHFEYSFDEKWYNPDTTNICPPAFGVEVPGHIWIGDEGKDQNCDGHIAWTERNRVELHFMIIFIDPNGVCCEPDLDSTLTGQITTLHNNAGVNLVNVTLNRPGSVFPTYITGPDGNYSFELILSDDEATIIPEKNIGHKNGVTTLDLVRIQKHLLGIAPFTSPDQYISADANNSQNVSAIDLIELRKLILGVYSELPLNTSWKFAAKDPGFVDSLGGVYYEPSITFTSELPDHPDFYGIKIGDVNYTANPLAINLIQPRSLPLVEWITVEQHVKQGQTLMVPFSLSESASIAGYQFTIEFPGFEFVALHSGAIDIGDEDFTLFNDQLTMSWFNENNIDVSAEDELFTIQLKAIRSGSISQSLSINSNITNAELYLANEETFLPVLNVVDRQTNSNLQIHSCAPNPWKEETIVNFYLPQSDNVTFTLLDVSGREVYITSKLLNGGNHRYQLKSSDFVERGMMFLEISTSKDKSFQKMIVLD